MHGLVAGAAPDIGEDTGRRRRRGPKAGEVGGREDGGQFNGALAGQDRRDFDPGLAALLRAQRDVAADLHIQLSGHGSSRIALPGPRSAMEPLETASAASAGSAFGSMSIACAGSSRR